MALKLYDIFSCGTALSINLSCICNDKQLTDRWFFNCSLQCQHFYSHLDLLAVYRSIMYMLFTRLYMSIPRKSFDNFFLKICYDKNLLYFFVLMTSLLVSKYRRFCDFRWVIFSWSFLQNGLRDTFEFSMDVRQRIDGVQSLVLNVSRR